MSVRRGGLGRGLGALIPTAPRVRADRPGGPDAAADGPAAPRRGGESAALAPAGRALRRAADRRDHARTRASRAQVFDEEAHGRAGALDPRDRPAAAGRGAAAGGGAATSWSWASAAGGPPQQAGLDDRSRRSSARPTTTPCCATRCWRTCTAASSTRWRRPRPTTSCSQDFGCTHEELAQPDRPLAPADHQHAAAAQAARRPCSAGSPPACCRPATPGRCSRSTTPRRRSGWRTGSSPRGCRCAPSRRSWRSARPDRRRSHAARDPGQAPTAPGLADLAARLSDRLETRVKVDLGQTQGKITIEFATLDDLRPHRRHRWTREPTTGGRAVARWVRD